jgi:hypothetical protein
MKTNCLYRSTSFALPAPAPDSPGFCRKAIAQIDQAKTAIVSEFQTGLEEHAKLLRLAVNEAEALAWQTDYPHLFFPTLATEKAQAVATWHAHQRSLQPTNDRPALAA